MDSDGQNATWASERDDISARVRFEARFAL